MEFSTNDYIRMSSEEQAQVLRELEDALRTSRTRVDLETVEMWPRDETLRELKTMYGLQQSEPPTATPAPVPGWVTRLQAKGWKLRPATGSRGFPPPVNRRPAHPLVALWRRMMRRLRGL